MPELGGKFMGCGFDKLSDLGDAGFRETCPGTGHADDACHLTESIKNRRAKAADVIVVFHVVHGEAAAADFLELGDQRFFAKVGSIRAFGKFDPIQ